METCVNYNEAPPVKPVSTVAVVNSFVISTTRFLNQFSFHCERKIADISRHLTRLETTVTLLESKLESIPEVSGIHGDAALPLTNEPPAPVPAEPELQPPPVDGTSVSALPAVQQDEAIPQPPAPESTAGGSVQTEVPAGMVTNDKNPLYKKYFKLLGFGAVPEQIKRQMAADGFDPSILDNPSGYGLAPGGSAETVPSVSSPATPSVTAELPPAPAASDSREGASSQEQFSLPAVEDAQGSLPAVEATDEQAGLPEVLGEDNSTGALPAVGNDEGSSLPAVDDAFNGDGSLPAVGDSGENAGLTDGTVALPTQPQSDLPDLPDVGVASLPDVGAAADVPDLPAVGVPDLPDGLSGAELPGDAPQLPDVDGFAPPPMLPDAVPPALPCIRHFT